MTMLIAASAAATVFLFFILLTLWSISDKLSEIRGKLAAIIDVLQGTPR